MQLLCNMDQQILFIDETEPQQGLTQSLTPGCGFRKRGLQFGEGDQAGVYEPISQTTTCRWLGSMEVPR